MKEIYTKLLEVQKEVGAIVKNAENPYFKKMYIDINGLLDELKPLLNKHGLIVLQPLNHIFGKPAIETVVVDAESGSEMRTMTPLPENIDPQKMGSAITYFRRYSLQSLFLLQAEDDDANAASSSPTPSQPPPAAPRTPPYKFEFKKKEPTTSVTAPLCFHGEPAKLLVVKKAGPNHGKEFYACARDRDDQCSNNGKAFFVWKDELIETDENLQKANEDAALEAGNGDLG